MNDGTNQARAPVPRSRRNFLTTSAAVAGGTLLGALEPGRFAHGTLSSVLKLGLVGCGGRGAGAVSNALTPECNRDAVLWAVADLFPEKIEPSLKTLTEMFKDRIQVPPERRFTGFSGYRGGLAVRCILH